MQTAEYNHNDFADTAEADKALMVRFFYKDVQNKLETEAQGRPIFKEKLYIEIRVAGQRDVQACRPATHKDKQRFPRHLEAFEKRTEPPTEGMPLIEWPKITRSQAEELAFMNVKTVEQLASMKDSNIQKFMGGYKLREAAVKWLELNDTATEDAEKADLKAQVATLTEQVEMLMGKTPATAEVAQKWAERDMESTKDLTDELEPALEQETVDTLLPELTQAEIGAETAILGSKEVGSLNGRAEAEPEPEISEETARRIIESPVAESLAGKLDQPEKTDIEKVAEGQAVPVPAAPAAKKPVKRSPRKR